MKNSLDIVNLMRRIRLHGFALPLLLETPLLKLMSDVTIAKPVTDPDTQTQSQWAANE